MTATDVAPTADMWDSRPSWGIAADLTPPELQEARRLKRLRRRLLMAGVALAALAVVVFGLAWFNNHRAEGDLATQRAHAAALRQQAAQYSQVTTMKSAVAEVHVQLSGLMANDVDVPALLASVVAAAPSGVHITQLSLDFGTGSGSGQPAAGTAATAGSLDTSGHKHIGSVHLTGTGHAIDDLPAFAAKLSALSGVVDVLPISNSIAASGTQFALSFAVTDVRLTNRFGQGPR